MTDNFVGRQRELGTLRTALDGDTAAIHLVHGLRGVGKSGLVARATERLPRVLHRAPPLPDTDQRAALAASLRTAGWLGVDGDATPSWKELWAAAAAAPPGPPRVLVIDDAHRLAQARSRWLAPCVGSLAAGGGAPTHVVVVGPAGVGLPTDEELGEVAGITLSVPPLPFRAARALLPRGAPLEALRAYAVFGGVPGVLAALQPSASLATNLRRAVLDPSGPLATWGLDALERDVQSPARYVAVLASLARGEARWRAMHQGISDQGGSGQVAPYLKRLEELGWVEVRRSLDTRPRGRARRYRITDPFLAFWSGFAPVLQGGAPAPPGQYLAAVIRPELDAHAASVLPEVCRQYMRHDALELLASNARECGSLWGEGYDIPVAGTLSSGAIFFGHAAWARRAPREPPLAALDREVRETRYGFGRERRLRILFSATPPNRALERQVAQRHDALLVDAAMLAGQS